MKSWRLLLEGACPPERNMPRDAQLYEQVAAGQVAGCLRIYNWSAPALTLGYNQKDFTAADASLELPRYLRPTGGGAVLHSNDLTYALAAPTEGPLSGSLLQAYHAIASVFAAALKACGIAAELVERQAAFASVCFERASVHELSVDGCKIMGAAQHRSRGFLLQQGVLPLAVDAKLMRRAFGVNTPLPRGLLEIKPDFSVDEFVAALIPAFADVLGVRLAAHS
jgi:lipoate-protein ligase A